MTDRNSRSSESTPPEQVNEVSEDQIATVTINEICDALHSDVDLVYDALVASDYIEEISEA